jgi:large-conductance mechanosensitive channel
MVPRAEIAHWLAASAVLFFGLVLLSEVIVGTEVFRRRRWRAYLAPAMALGGGVLLWIIVVFSTFSTMHLLAHAVWAQVAMIAGAVQFAIVREKLTSPLWSLVVAGGLLLSGLAFVVHEQNPWLFSRSAFLHHAIGWTLVAAAVFPLAQALQPRRVAWQAGFALTFVAVAALLYADRDVAPIFGHLSELAGGR